MSSFKERLKELRLEKGLSIKQLAKEIGVSDVAIGRWEKDLRVANIYELIKLAKFFDVTTDYLLGLTDF